MSFGKPFADFHEWTLNPAQTEEVVRHALDIGINFFDTANTYAHGTSEEYLGRTIKNNISRDRVILASKVYFNDGHLSKRMMTTIKLNLTFSMTLNFIATALAVMGKLNPVTGALVHNAGSVTVIINSILLLKWRKNIWKI